MNGSGRWWTLALALLVAGAARAEPALELQPQMAKPGDPVLITVRDAELPPTGTLGDRPLRFYPWKDGFQAMTGLPVEVVPGVLTARVSFPAPDEATPPVELRATLEVLPPGYPSRELQVASRFVEPPPPELQARIEADQEAFANAYAQPFGPRLFTRSFAWPRPPRITAPYGDLRMFNGQVQSQHFGTDFGGKVGAPIKAANDGRVVMVRSCFYSGNTVILHHGANLYTAYFHLSKALVKTGNKVRQGQRIGLVGRTGRVTGPHLHWAVKVDDLYVDGATLMKLDFQ